MLSKVSAFLITYLLTIKFVILVDSDFSDELSTVPGVDITDK